MAKLDYTDIKAGQFFSMEGVIYECVSNVFSKKSRQKGSNQVKIKNIITGAIISKTLHSSDTLESVSIEKENYVFVFKKGNTVVLHKENNPADRVEVDGSFVAGISFLPTKTKVTAITSGEKILTITPPIKVDVEVKEAPPVIKGSTVQSQNKKVLIETGVFINAPMFIEVGDIIRINIEGVYIERVKKNSK